MGNLAVSPKTPTKTKKKPATKPALPQEEPLQKQVSTGFCCLRTFQFCNITKLHSKKPLFPSSPRPNQQKEYKPKPKNQPKPSPKQNQPTWGGYPIFTSKSQGKDGLETGGGGLVFVTKNHHKYGFKKAVISGAKRPAIQCFLNTWLLAYLTSSGFTVIAGNF